MTKGQKGLFENDATVSRQKNNHIVVKLKKKAFPCEMRKMITSRNERRALIIQSKKIELNLDCLSYSVTVIKENCGKES